MKHNKTCAGIKLRRTIGGHWHGWIYRIPVKFVKQKGWNGKNVLCWYARVVGMEVFREGLGERSFLTLTRAIQFAKGEFSKKNYNDQRRGDGGFHTPSYQQPEGWE